MPEIVRRSGKTGVSDSLIVLLPSKPRYTKVVFTGPMTAFHTGIVAKYGGRATVPLPLPITALQSPRA